MATKAQINDFVNLIAPSVLSLCKEFGWGVPSAIIAQAGKETGWGTSGLWKSAYNLCGQKWVVGQSRGYVEMKTKEQRPDGSYITIIAKFIKYSDVTDGIRGYFEFIEKYKRYVPVIQSKTYTEYALKLKSCGWATSITYAQSIISLVETYNLTRFDGADVTSPAPVPKKTIFKIGDRGEEVIHIQKFLATCGYQVGAIDGIYGQRTASCVKQYQIEKGISADGIWGPVTQATVGK